MATTISSSTVVVPSVAASGEQKTVTADIVDEKELDKPYELLSATHPRKLIPELCSLFYTLKWVTGTGGGISIRDGDDVYVAPSGVQKERMRPCHMFVMNRDGTRTLSSPPVQCCLTASQCTPLFFQAYRLRNAGACIHTHSQAAVMATLLSGDCFTITHQEMIKGIRIGIDGPAMKFWQTLTIPIIENTADERDLTERMGLAMKHYPNTNAILVRRHGLYVWGKDWISAKTQAECLDYLFEIALSMKQAGIDWSVPPATSPYLPLAIADRSSLVVTQLERDDGTAVTDALRTRNITTPAKETLPPC